jgi:hypothetical protein
MSNVVSTRMQIHNQDIIRKSTNLDNDFASKIGDESRI